MLAVSAATIDRVLAPVRTVSPGGRRRRNAYSSSVRRSVPVRTYADWRDPAPGYMEADLVAHSGPSASGSFVQTLTLTDVATGWTECAPLLFREQRLLSEVLSALRPALPFPLLGFDTDNDSVFMNETIKDWCDAAQVAFTRSRPYRKNDQAYVEQKNGAVVRRMVGYRRYTGVAAATVLAQLYRSMRLYVNFFQPSFKLMEKTRDGARVTKRYHPPLTPFQGVLAHPAVASATKDALATQFAQLDPVALLHDIRQPITPQRVCMPRQRAFDSAKYKLRNRIERTIGKLKQLRRHRHPIRSHPTKLPLQPLPGRDAVLALNVDKA